MNETLNAHFDLLFLVCLRLALLFFVHSAYLTYGDVKKT